MSPQVFSFLYESASEQRLDHYLVAALPQYSRARLQHLIKEGAVRINGNVPTKPGTLLGPGAVVDVSIPDIKPAGVIGEDIPLRIVFENADVIVVDKPAGMVVHPAAGHATGTLVNAALGHDPHMRGIGGEERPGVVHRLDKDTSGLILLAKNDSALEFLQRQFRLRQVRKTYLALVDGRPPTPTGRIEAEIGRDRSHRKQMALVSEGRGRNAVTTYSTLETFPAHTLLELHPQTGRTHQIRLHCAFIGTPIVGDSVYGKKRPSLPLTRQFLHAAKILVTLPGESEPRQFEAEVPPELESILAGLRSQSVPFGGVAKKAGRT